VKNIILVIVAVVLLAIAAVSFYLRSGEQTEIPNQYRIHGVCLETHKEFTLTVKASDAMPFVNPETGRRTVYTWWFCADCRHRFIPELVASPDGGPPHYRPFPLCTNCGSNCTGTWFPEDPEQEHPDGDGPLPPLP